VALVAGLGKRFSLQLERELMANYFYTDANGLKQGPISREQLHELATRGTITPETPLETDIGHKGLAGQIPRLFAATEIKQVAQPIIRKPMVVAGVAFVISFLFLLFLGKIVFAEFFLYLQLNSIDRTTVNRIMADHRGGRKHDGSTPLHHEAVNLEIAGFFLAKGVDVNAKKNDGATPLHSASGFGNIAVVEYLVSKGADVNAKMNDGTTPLHNAVKAYLKNNDAILFSPRPMPFSFNYDYQYGKWERAERDFEIIKYLVSVGADVKATANSSSWGQDGKPLETPLDIAEQSTRGALVVDYLSRFQ